jgi:hypothetical protein
MEAQHPSLRPVPPSTSQPQPFPSLDPLGAFPAHVQHASPLEHACDDGTCDAGATAAAEVANTAAETDDEEHPPTPALQALTGPLMHDEAADADPDYKAWCGRPSCLPWPPEEDAVQGARLLDELDARVMQHARHVRDEGDAEAADRPSSSNPEVGSTLRVIMKLLVFAPARKPALVLSAVMHLCLDVRAGDDAWERGRRHDEAWGSAALAAVALSQVRPPPSGPSVDAKAAHVLAACMGGRPTNAASQLLPSSAWRADDGPRFGLLGCEQLCRRCRCCQLNWWKLQPRHAATRGAAEREAGVEIWALGQSAPRSVAL